MRKLRIAVVGAGPAGLVAALSARRLGLEVEVFEQAADFRRVGGGVLIHSNGQRVLERLEVLESFRPNMRLTQELAIELPGGKRIQTADYTRVTVAHNQAAVVLRYQLQEHLLIEAARLGVVVHFDHRCEQAEGGQLCFANGTQAEADVVIAADGIHSKVRESADLVGEKLPLGQAYVRAVSEVPTANDAIREILSPDGRRFGICPLPGNRTYFFCRVPMNWRELITNPTQRANWIESWSHLGPEVLALLRGVPDWERVSYDELHELRLGQWARPPTFVVGDAAHAMTPNLGQGANSAMVDALVLTRMLAEEPDLARVAFAYDQLRRPFVTRIQTSARLAGMVLSLEAAPARWLRDGMLRLFGAREHLTRPSLMLMAGFQPEEERFLAAPTS